MNKIIGAALILIGSLVLGYAAEPGASGFSPGHQKQEHGSIIKGHPGASGYSPGHERQEHGSIRGHPGSSGYAPGQKMK
jgi:hypothetical protein